MGVKQEKIRVFRPKSQYISEIFKTGPDGSLSHCRLSALANLNCPKLYLLLCLRPRRAEALSDMLLSDVCLSRTSDLTREQRGLED